MELLCEYDFDIKHIKGKGNKEVDTFNRKMHVMHVAINTTTSYSKDIIKEENDTYEFFQQEKAGLHQLETTHKFENYKWEDGILSIRIWSTFLTQKM